MSKEEKTKKASSSGIGISGLIFVLFLGLKLAEIGPVAKWSWWWVTSPLWIPPVLIIAIAALIGIGALIYYTYKALRK